MRDQLFDAWQFALANRLSLPALTIMLHMMDGPIHCANLSTALGVPPQNITTSLKNLRHHKLVCCDARWPRGWYLSETGILLINLLQSTLANHG